MLKSSQLKLRAFLFQIDIKLYWYVMIKFMFLPKGMYKKLLIIVAIVLYTHIM